MILLNACSIAEDESKRATDSNDQCKSENLIEHTIDIPAGTYLIGDDRFYREEMPIKRVDLAAFNIDATEVSNSQFSEFVEATQYITRAERGLPESEFEEVPAKLRQPGSMVFTPSTTAQNLIPASWWTFVGGASWRTPEGPGSSIVGRENHPVVHVAFEDAFAYAKWKRRRLPTEDEWEVAARGLDDVPHFTSGEFVVADLPPQSANIWQGIFPIINQKTDGYEGSAPVGCYPPNPFGIYDMIGNVWELTSSEYHPVRSAKVSHIDVNKPDWRFENGVIKGGSFLCSDNYCLRYRPAARQPHEWALSSSHIGFRTVKSIAVD